MPLLQTNPVDIVLEIPDVQIGSTTVKRKAKLHALIYNMQSKSVSISWVVTMYAKNQDGSYGDEMSALIPSYTKEQVATNDVPVNPQTGFPIDPQSIMPVITPQENGDAIVTPSTVEWVGQYDFFNAMGENTPIKVHDVIRQFGLGATNWDK